jgi:hypothetical protein
VFGTSLVYIDDCAITGMLLSQKEKNNGIRCYTNSNPISQTTFFFVDCVEKSVKDS